MKDLLFRSLTTDAVLVLARKLLAKTGSARPISDRGTQDTVDAYIEEQMHRLKIPGVSLAIVEGDRYWFGTDKA